MKRFIGIFAAFLMTTLAFSNTVKGLFEVINVTPENIEIEFSKLEAGKNYAINFEENFDFSKLKKNFYQYQMVQTIHDLFENGSFLKFTGPFDYIFFEGIQTVNNISVIKTMIESSPEKRYCVDISNSLYEKADCVEMYTDSDGYYNIPFNCFSEHENLYWVYFGSFLRKNIPAGTCENLENLQAVFFCDEGDIQERAFKNVNPECLYICDNNNPVLLADYVAEKREARKKNIRDYRDYSPSYEYDQYSGVEWMVDGDTEYSQGWWEKDLDEEFSSSDSDDDIPFYSFVDDETLDYNSLGTENSEENELDIVNIYIDLMYNSVKDDIIWDDFSLSNIQINKMNAVELIPESIDFMNPEEVALAFMASYYLGTDDYEELMSDNPMQPFEVDSNNSILTYSEYSDVKSVVYLRDMSSGNETSSEEAFYAFGIDYEKNGQMEKDITILIAVKSEEGNWKIIQVRNAFLKYYLLLMLYDN